jgi:hypothetical protein
MCLTTQEVNNENHSHCQQFFIYVVDELDLNLQSVM